MRVLRTPPDNYLQSYECLKMMHILLIITLKCVGDFTVFHNFQEFQHFYSFNFVFKLRYTILNIPHNFHICLVRERKLAYYYYILTIKKIALTRISQKSKIYALFVDL